MKRITTIIFLLAASLAMLQAQTKVMSHRGFYAHPGSFENTLTSLKGAQDLAVEAIELDVHLTTRCPETGFQDGPLLHSSQWRQSPDLEGILHPG